LNPVRHLPAKAMTVLRHRGQLAAAAVVLAAASELAAALGEPPLRRPRRDPLRERRLLLASIASTPRPLVVRPRPHGRDRRRRAGPLSLSVLRREGRRATRLAGDRLRRACAFVAALLYLVYWWPTGLSFEVLRFFIRTRSAGQWAQFWLWLIPFAQDVLHALHGRSS
jgi:hypothetical protein